MDKMFLVDLSKCTGCEACIDACSGRHTGIYSEKASRIRLKKDEARTVFIPLVCEHCAQHPCVDVCPVEAIDYDPSLGIFLIDEETCTLCGLCAEACPYDGIFVNDDLALKCNLCQGDPQCVKFCYPEALCWVDVNSETALADLRSKARKLEELRGTYNE